MPCLKITCVLDSDLLIISSGVARVNKINVSSNSGWAGKITELQILPHMGANNSQGGQVDLYWISSSPNGPSN